MYLGRPEGFRGQNEAENLPTVFNGDGVHSTGEPQTADIQRDRDQDQTARRRGRVARDAGVVVGLGEGLDRSSREADIHKLGAAKGARHKPGNNRHRDLVNINLDVILGRRSSR